jgi:hypothetical protein
MFQVLDNMGTFAPIERMFFLNCNNPITRDEFFLLVQSNDSKILRKIEVRFGKLLVIVVLGEIEAIQ